MSDETTGMERQLIELFTLAGEYCLMVENAEQHSKEELLEFFGKISPILYVRGLLFPAVEEPEEEGDERYVTEEQWENAFNSLRNKFALDDPFRYTDPCQPESDEVIYGSLAELIADVYQDMKDFSWLMTKSLQVARDYAAFNIKQWFLSNWGHKLLLAQLVIHSRFLNPDKDSSFPDLD